MRAKSVQGIGNGSGSLVPVVLILFTFAYCVAGDGRSNTSSAPSSPQNGPWAAFGLGTIGAIVMYAYIFREKRLAIALQSFGAANNRGRVITTASGVRVLSQGEWKMLVFDLLITICLGGFAAMMAASEGAWKEAILCGCTWNSFFSRLAENKPVAS